MSRVKKTEGRTEPWERVIYGSPQSKANSRRLAMVKGRLISIKSASALAYLADFLKQCPNLSPMFEDDVFVSLRIYYASRRNDLDESLILDALQGKVYRNDRQVRRKYVEWGLDAENPRTLIRIEPIEPV